MRVSSGVDIKSFIQFCFCFIYIIIIYPTVKLKNSICIILMEIQSCATHQYENYKLKIAESIIAINSFSVGKTPRCYFIHRASNWWMLSVIHNTWIWHTPRHVVFLMFETYDYSLWEETITVVSWFCISNILIYLNRWTEPRPHACIGYGFLHRFVRSDDRKILLHGI